MLLFSHPRPDRPLEEKERHVKGIGDAMEGRNSGCEEARTPSIVRHGLLLEFEHHRPFLLFAAVSRDFHTIVLRIFACLLGHGIRITETVTFFPFEKSNSGLMC